ncbi:hypothetical protein [Photobacterium damselae]|uniref:hypothetical protein n=1 Tax=Photobacterium damselae TaxID=38293 RepID=UPI001F1F1FDF|nr:hypothetical protein [Photobacterium damselae]UKA07005.1 hypothetical protein IHC90_04280 [Photobacterium damselae subsp. damselae]
MFFNTGLAKPTFFYQEPSHFALVAAPFILYFTFTLKRKFCLLLLMFSAFWALYIQNATMLFIVLMASWVSLRVNFFYLILLLLSAVTLLIFSNPDGLAYFQERIILSSDSNNLSVLVLIQGWENALKTLQEFSIFGAGFQQFGVGTALGSASDKINQLIGFGLNLYDGGSLAPKIIGEFGILGILVIIYYCFIFISSVNKLKYLNKDSDKILIFSYCSIISVFVEIFIRGAGYFTPSLFMFLISLFYLKFFYLRIKFRS